LEQVTRQHKITELRANHPQTSYLGRQQRELYFLSKRLLDIVIASAALLILAPAMLITAMLIRLTSCGPAIFKQERVTTKRTIGQQGQTWEITTFTCYKFRSMYTNTNCEHHRAYIDAFIKKDQQGMTQINGGNTAVRKLVNDDPQNQH
jgi:lipopolysaccharide/colanic/teichoic acid biosynthesis glycosyltransferase